MIGVVNVDVRCCLSLLVQVLQPAHEQCGGYGSLLRRGPSGDRDARQQPLKACTLILRFTAAQHVYMWLREGGGRYLMGPIRALSNQMEACLPILNLGFIS